MRVFGLTVLSLALIDSNAAPTSAREDISNLRLNVFRTLAGGGNQMCHDPNNKQTVQEVQHCKLNDGSWTALAEEKNIEVNNRQFSNECGPHCRPSCITLMLDLDKLQYDSQLICEEDKLCQCATSKCNYECSTDEFEAMLEEHPKCYLETKDCLGPTMYDDFAAYALNSCQQGVPGLKHCTAVPDDDLYCRFKDFPLVTPQESFDSCNQECFDSSKIYFEYCNIVEEDPNCDQCNNQSCGKRCKKITEPFPAGWTTFVVSAPIPYPQSSNQQCDKVLQYEAETEMACFLQRIEIYYPPEETETCNKEYDCPICHDCPLLSLGDKFGPLEVVGFGHCINTICAACDKQSEKECGSCNGNCNFNCESSVDCATGESLGIPGFAGNNCSFCG